MFHVKQTKIHLYLAYLFLFLIPLQLRILYFPDQAYISDYFSYQKAIFLYLSDLVLIVFILSWLLHEKPKFHVELRRIAFPLLILAFTGLFHVKQLNIGLYTGFKWLELIFLMFYMKHQFGIKEINIGTVLIFASAIIQATIAIFQFHVQHYLGLSLLGEYIAPLGTSGLSTIDVSGEKLIRAYGTFPHPNVLGAFLVFGLFMGLYIVSRETYWRRWVVSCGTILLVVGIFLSFSRIAWFGAGLALASFFFYNIYKKSYQKALTIVLIGLVSCGTIWGFYGKLLENRVFEFKPSSNSIVLRESFNQMAFEVFKNKPLLGVGIGNYIPTLEEKVALEPWQYQPAHNIFLHLATEMGLVGVGFFLLLMYVCLRSTWNKRKILIGFTFLALGITFGIMSLFDHYFVTIQQGRLMFFAVLGFMWTVSNINLENDQQ
jgi:O-antigen ligase